MEVSCLQGFKLNKYLRRYPKTDLVLYKESEGGFYIVFHISEFKVPGGLGTDNHHPANECIAKGICQLIMYTHDYVEKEDGQQDRNWFDHFFFFLVARVFLNDSGSPYLLSLPMNFVYFR